jgi:hypothetical protein
MTPCRWRDTLTWAGPLAMALFGGIAMLAGDSGAASAEALSPPSPPATSASVGTGTGSAATAPRTLVEAEARHRALWAKCQRLPVAATVAECQRNADRQRALDRARLLPHAGASAASSPRPR